MNYKLESLGNERYRIKIIDEDITIKTIETTTKEIITTNFFSNSINELVELGVDKNEAAKLIMGAVQEVAKTLVPKDEEKNEGQEKSEELPEKLYSLKDFFDYFREVIKDDEEVMALSFFTCLSAYTNEPLNLFIRGETSTGKSYTPKNVWRVFPKEDVWLLGGLSPTALVHQYGELIDEEGNTIKFPEEPSYEEPVLPPPPDDEKKKKEWEKQRKEAEKKAVAEYKKKLKEWRKNVAELLKKSKTVIDMRGKILLFLDAPQRETYEKLKPILSHDEYEIEFKYTDRDSEGRLVTRSAIIRGWPATIFCTAKIEYLEELSTRSLTVSPRVSEEKHKKANFITGKTFSSPSFKKARELKAEELRKYISKVKALSKNVEEVVVPFAEEISKAFPAKAPRSMRDFKHLLGIVTAVATFNIVRRPIIKVGEKRYVLATMKDVKTALNVFQKVFEQTTFGLARNQLELFDLILEKQDESSRATSDKIEIVKEAIRKHSSFEDIVVECKMDKNEVMELIQKLILNGVVASKDGKRFELKEQPQRRAENSSVRKFSLREIVDAWNSMHKDNPKSDKTINEWLVTLQRANLIQSEPDPEDKRRTLYFPVVFNSSQKSVFSIAKQIPLKDFRRIFKENWSSIIKDGAVFQYSMLSTTTHAFSIERVYSAVFGVPFPNNTKLSFAPQIFGD